jgi:hypothetical protein
VLAIERLKLAVFCLKLHERTSRDIPDMTELTRDNFTFIEDQKREEDGYLLNKDQRPKLKPMSINVHSAPTCFDKVLIILNAMLGCTGIPLTYVICLSIEEKYKTKDPRFDQTNSPYGSIDKEMVARAPIVAHNSAKRTPEQLKEDGPFTSAFSTDTKKVYLVLYSILGANLAWQHVKKYQQAQAGRKAWRIIHAHFFGGNKATALCQQTLKRLGDLKYDGLSNPKKWSFDKYTTAP